MTLKRFTARAKGRGNRISKPTCHLRDGRRVRDPMGQKIHPTGFRLAVTRNWGSAGLLLAAIFHDAERGPQGSRHLKKKLAHASVSRVVIERPAKNARITVFSARPGVVIGKKGEDIEKLKADLQGIMGVPVHVNIEEVRKPEPTLS